MDFPLNCSVTGKHLCTKLVPVLSSLGFKTKIWPRGAAQVLAGWVQPLLKGCWNVSPAPSASSEPPRWLGWKTFAGRAWSSLVLGGLFCTEAAVRGTFSFVCWKILSRTSYFFEQATDWNRRTQQGNNRFIPGKTFPIQRENLIFTELWHAVKKAVMKFKTLCLEYVK